MQISITFRDRLDTQRFCFSSFIDYSKTPNNQINFQFDTLINLRIMIDID